MRRWSVLLVGILAPVAPRRAPGQPAAAGKAVYDRWCSGCHGDAGAGDGSAAAFMLPRPRDFTKGVFKIRSTASGELPLDDDLRRVVADGMPGTAMPEWKSRLSERERDDVVAYVKTFSPFFSSGTGPKAIAVGREPSGTPAGLAAGRTTFVALECFKCHGPQGRGDGKSAPTLKDDYGAPIRAADLTESWKFRGGSTVPQIYTRLRTGLDGTPMPSNSDAVENKIITDEQLWHVAQYVRSLSGERPPEVREVVRAMRAPALPASPDDRAWSVADRYWLPLVGQIIAKPRWFAPTIDGVWVQAMHDGRQLALRVTWHDPSKSPDPAWDPWLERISKTISDVDGPLPTQQGPDRLVVQFPTHAGEDAERPYFLGGSARRPAYVWRWTSAPDSVEVGTQRGLGQFTALASAAPPAHAARFEDGEWRVQLSRALIPADTSREPRFEAGRSVPIAFFVADGSNGEGEIRGAVSTWYAIYLDTPTPPVVYVAPAATVLLTAGIGATLIGQAQRRGRRAAGPHVEERS